MKKLGLVVIGMLLLVASLVLLVGMASAGPVATGAVCPHGNVKFEVPGGYEYNDGSAWVTGGENSVCWGANSGYEVTGVCIKIGGPGGGSLIWEGPGDGCGGPYDYGISHVVVYTEPTPPPATCDEACEEDRDCEDGLDCIGNVCRNPDCPAEEDCICPLPPATCDEACETETDCEEELTCSQGVCRNPDCLEEADCICPLPPPSECNESCELDADCAGGLKCVGNVCRNPDCPGEEDCVCPLPPPVSCNEVCEVDTNCEEGYICYYGRCRDPICPEKKNCVCPPCPNPLLIKVVTRCGVGVPGVNVHLESGRGDRIPSPDKPPMFTDSTGTVVFTRDMGITPRDNKEWRIYLDGVLHDTFKVTECEQTITIYNDLPCPPPTPTPTPELPRELPKTGIGPPPSTLNLPDLRVVRVVGLALMVVGREILRKRK